MFGSAHTAPGNAQSQTERNHLMATLPPEQLLTEKPTNYRHWWNNSWYLVEEGGAPRAGEWTAAKMDRLRALVNHAPVAVTAASVALLPTGKLGGTDAEDVGNDMISSAASTLHGAVIVAVTMDVTTASSTLAAAAGVVVVEAVKKGLTNKGVLLSNRIQQVQPAIRCVR